MTTTLQHLQAWQAAVEPLERALSQALLVIDLESDLVKSIFAQSEAYDRLVAETVGCDPDMLIDWRVSHDLGKRPMKVAIDDVWRVVDTVEKLAEFIEEVK